MPMDTISLENLVFAGNHGLTPAEQKRKQRFSVGIWLELDLQRAAASDDLQYSVDYQEIKDIVQSVIEGKSRKLIETLAEGIAAQILKNKKIHSVWVSVKKLDIWKNGVPGVIIRRGKRSR